MPYSSSCLPFAGRNLVQHIDGAQLAGFEVKGNGVGAATDGTRRAGPAIGADIQSADIQSFDDGAGGFTAGNDEAADAVAMQIGGDIAEQLFDAAARTAPAEFLL